jgi:hypothetical protein
MHFPLPDHSIDCVVSAYVLDLLPEEDILQAISEARRMLIPGGKLCLVSLTQGVSFISRIFIAVWSAVFRFRPSLLGGCRPIQLNSFFGQDIWSIKYCNVVTRFGIPSEILITSPKSRPNDELQPTPKNGAAER